MFQFLLYIVCSFSSVIGLWRAMTRPLLQPWTLPFFRYLLQACQNYVGIKIRLAELVDTRCWNPESTIVPGERMSQYLTHLIFNLFFIQINCEDSLGLMGLEETQRYVSSSKISQNLHVLRQILLVMFTALPDGKLLIHHSERSVKGRFASEC